MVDLVFTFHLTYMVVVDCFELLQPSTQPPKGPLPQWLETRVTDARIGLAPLHHEDFALRYFAYPDISSLHLNAWKGT